MPNGMRTSVVRKKADTNIFQQQLRVLREKLADKDTVAELVEKGLTEISLVSGRGEPYTKTFSRFETASSEQKLLIKEHLERLLIFLSIANNIEKLADHFPHRLHLCWPKPDSSHRVKLLVENNRPGGARSGECNWTIDLDENAAVVHWIYPF